jgi:hypothetical protein
MTTNEAKQIVREHMDELGISAFSCGWDRPRVAEEMLYPRLTAKTPRYSATSYPPIDVFVHAIRQPLTWIELVNRCREEHVRVSFAPQIHVRTPYESKPEYGV